MTDLRTEAALLTDVLVERLSALRGATAAGASTTAADADPICPTCGHDATRTDCAGCPVCAVLAVLRGDRPESTAALLDGAITAVTAVRTLLDSTARPAASPAGTPSPARSSGPHPAPDAAAATVPTPGGPTPTDPTPTDPTRTDPTPTDPAAIPEPGPRRSERISIT